MQSLLLMLAVLGLTPLLFALARLQPTASGIRPWPRLASLLLCTLAFNLTFFWQELWLVIPKALTPGLHPTLYHNDHDWTGEAPVTELLQGTGALATLTSGLASLGLLAALRRLSPGWRLLLFWLALQGVFQALSQFAIGSLLPGNDVGRALAFLRAPDWAKWLLLAASAAAMAAAGRGLAGLAPAGVAAAGATGARAFAWAVIVTASACVMLSIPFRAPRHPIEVVLIPVVVNLLGVGWLAAGAVFAGRRAAGADAGVRLAVAGPAIALLALLAVFQLVLRPGVPF